MITPDVYYLRVDSDTRNHKGSFIQDTVYQLIEIDSSGWALICQDQATCYYVDPICLQETPT